MGSADFILVINLFVAGLLAAAFMTIAIHDVGRVSARWMAFAYGLGMAYFAMEFSIPAFTDARLPVVVAFAVFLGATIAFNGGLARKYGVAPPWVPMLLFLAVASVAVYLVQDLPRQSLTRMMAYQLPYAAMQFTALGIVLSSRQRLGRLDHILMLVLAASAAQFASKPLIAGALGGWGANPQSYVQTIYALVSQSLGTVFGLAVALLALAILVRDVLAEATSKSETDTLSRLFNRRGFERHAAFAMRDAVRQGVPVALLIADLDYFKSVNDSYGHACGDRVIETFAGFLREAAAEHHVAGRIGGEEFAIILPGTNLAAARLFAEGARSAFSALPIDGLPVDHRCSASFGVAELAADESFSDLLRRADDALYAAKNAGRDCVRVSTGRGLRQGPMLFNGKG
ncbi:GGDEF domain-containing protein [Mesorhizobium sp. M1C.F.Ca.ET.193.01.1.1]|uniref:GGDEF domain-containing protein n=1 Tax=unclassified Mesorhizobium TaxID=325217 RepID=UPI000FD303EC|nr:MULTISPECIES: GGDEF domain-containing protein [unclassified Mesorhizobium]TGS91898.1 GGDEF domain-containing protein [bacterium M00.F.Ca.ET.177.01.1.1]TGQ49979.1 GGDEF domain-containing protein [Mesorhizobium sp. M1C.F.Ca.ET.210.01.1.1]TGQ64437.1 GGDEF domain-containing protein [Mesorhizobium sp. M1C.F.Ca.ET.212.01.1.1]TGQ98297.1 GGDEF domain-containing protein [Mesorhizobium sp. M1C.F.Ca.ET.204.01.1.1]TGR18513.1 GGDEF domain-containing protein [Mesorhizobium sp. M1C.F.Ca.ET.196.01.1.1]